MISANHFLSFRWSRIGALLRINSNKTLKVVKVYANITVSDDDEFEEYYVELESSLVVKSTYMVMVGDFTCTLAGTALVCGTAGVMECQQ